MLLTYDRITVEQDWHVTELAPPVFTRIYYVYGGSVTYTDETGSRALRAGHLYLFPTAIPYHMVQNPQDPLRCLFLHLDILPESLGRPADFDCAQDAAAAAIVAAMESVVPLRAAGEPVLAYLAQALLAHARQRGLLEPDDLPMREAARYISDHYAQKVTIAQLSALCGYHEKYFITRFCAAYGIPPHQYLCRYRLQRSCYLLKSGQSASQAAEQCGYPDLKSYCRAFGRLYGISPGVYAKRGLILP